ncbi:MAG TPA: phosphate-starvation-inducible PsiE family protein [Gemmatimonadaceae bacterium]|nr:phosphate-starvation-inducible PsiE family protein [Gemmatimonadaceae bacterium]
MTETQRERDPVTAPAEALRRPRARRVLVSHQGRGTALAPFTEVHGRLRRVLEWTQDALVAALVLVLFTVMLRSLWTLASHAMEPEVEVRAVLAELLYMMILVEFLRLLVIYLREHHVAVDVMVETSIVAALREVILHGITEMPPAVLMAVTAFLLALATLLRFGDLRPRDWGRSLDLRPGKGSERKGQPAE